MTHTAVVLADAARARIFTVETVRGQAGAPASALVERMCLVNPARRQRPSDRSSDTRPGSRRAAGGSGVGHAVDDRRDAHTDELDRRFAGDVVTALDKITREQQIARLVISASPRMLGLLRQGVGDRPHTTFLALDLSALTPARALEKLSSHVEL